MTGRIPGVELIRDVANHIKYRNLRGVFHTFEEATRAIPHSRASGYDSPASASLYMGKLGIVRPSDYPVLFWLSRILPQINSIFDFGGNIGLTYSAFREYLDLPVHLKWTICDVSAVVERGLDVARDRGFSHLSFTTDFAKADGAGLLLTCGTLQYLKPTLAELLEPLQRRPEHLFINRVPLSHRPTYYSLQDIHTAICPYRIQNRAELTESLIALGYSTVDEWECAEARIFMLRRPSWRIRSYSGMYFRLSPPRAGSNGHKSQ